MPAESRRAGCDKIATQHARPKNRDRQHEDRRRDEDLRSTRPRGSEDRGQLRVSRHTAANRGPALGEIFERTFHDGPLAPDARGAEALLSKLVAALDRQHPSDIFGVHGMFQRFGLMPEIV